MNTGSTFATVLERLMRSYPGGPLSMSALHRLTGMSRSTVFRHVRQGEVPTQDSISRYAKVFGVPEKDLLAAAGFPTVTEFSEEVMALATELSRLDRETLDAVWHIISLFRRNQQRP